jgi:hypothetical protein
MGQIWTMYGCDMGYSMGHIWVLYGIDMANYLPYETHMLSCIAFPLSSLWDRYVFRKNPYYSHI